MTDAWVLAVATLDHDAAGVVEDMEHSDKRCMGRHVGSELEARRKVLFPSKHGLVQKQALRDRFFGRNNFGEELADEDESLVVDLGQLDVLDTVLNVLQFLGVIGVFGVCSR